MKEERERFETSNVDAVEQGTIVRIAWADWDEGDGYRDADGDSDRDPSRCRKAAISWESGRTLGSPGFFLLIFFFSSLFFRQRVQRRSDDSVKKRKEKKQKPQPYGGGSRHDRPGQAV